VVAGIPGGKGLLVLIAVAALASVPGSARSVASASTAVGTRSGRGAINVGCFAQPGYRDDRYCGRLAVELARRAPLTAEQYQAAQSQLTNIQRVLADGGADACNRNRNVPCSRILEQARRPATAEEVRQRLTRAGYQGVVARVARADDPAPVGSVLHAVAVGPACLIGFQSTWEQVDGETIMAAGAGGACLAA
jgi:hypothetical protein